MTNDPQGPADTGNTSEEKSREDARQDEWEEKSFGGGGTEVTHDTATVNNPVSNQPTEELMLVQPQTLTPAEQSAVQLQAEQLGEALYSKFMLLLNSKLKDTGGHLTANDVNDMGEEFRSALAGIENAFLNAVETYANARQSGRTEQPRTNLFQRLLVRSFEESFVDEKALQDEPSLLSRRMLPGFAIMLSMMFGDEKLEDYEMRTHSIIDKLGTGPDGEVDWEAFFNSPKARLLSLQAEIEVAQYFREFDKRMEWMLAMVNSNLIPPEEGRFGDPWVFNIEAARRLLAGFFENLKFTLDSQIARQSIVKRLGTDEVSTLDEVVRRAC